MNTVRFAKSGGALVGIGAAVALSVFMLFSPAKAATPGEEAEAFIRDLANNAVAMLDDHEQTDAQREVEFRRLVRDGFALDTIGQFVVGRYWRQMTPEQQAEYQELFAEWMMKTYAGRLGGYRGQSLEVLRNVEAGSRDIVVRTMVTNADGRPPIAADWRVRKFDGEYKIIDVVVEGVSMVGAQKSEFESVIRDAGVEGLIDSLRQRLTKLVANSG